MSGEQATVADFDSTRRRVNRGEYRRYYCPKCGGAYRGSGLKSHWGRDHGELAPPWYPPKSDAKDRGVWQKLQRRLAFKRDGGACRICGVEDTTLKKSGEGRTHGLHLHHIKPVGDFEDDEFQHKLTNLVMVCPTHHRQLEGLSESEQRKRISNDGRAPVREDISDVNDSDGERE